MLQSATRIQIIWSHTLLASSSAVYHMPKYMRWLHMQLVFRSSIALLYTQSMLHTCSLLLERAYVYELTTSVQFFLQLAGGALRWRCSLRPQLTCCCAAGRPPHHFRRVHLARSLRMRMHLHQKECLLHVVVC